MGTFAGSVHFRTEDQELVLKAVRAAVKQRRTRCLVSPVLRGWVAVYPEEHGQDLEFGDALAAKVKCDVVQVLVHDSDVFCYRYYRKGKLVDEYNSRPDYFGEPERPVEETRGRPEAFAELVPGKVEELQRILNAAEEAVFAEETLEEFGEVLGLSNVASAYEYLEEGQTEGVQGWEGFVQVPKGHRPMAQRGVRTITTRRIGDDLLPEMRGMWHILVETEIGVVLGAAGPEGWLVIGQSPLQNYGQPWGSPPRVLHAGDALIAFEVSADRKLLAVAEAGNVVILDARSGQERQRLAIGRNARILQVGFSADAGRLVALAQGSLAVWDLGTGQRVHQRDGSGFAQACFAPDGRSLLIGERERWQLVSLETGEDLRHIYAGGRVQTPELTEEMQRRLERELARLVPKLARKAIRLDQDAIRDEANEHALTMMSSPDGRMLVCGMEEGLRVYRWEQILRGSEELAEPVFEFNQSGTALGGMSAPIHAISGIPGQNAVAFGSLNGVIRRMDLTSGDVSVLVRVGGGLWVKWLGFTMDGRQLGCVLSNQLTAIGIGSAGSDAFVVAAMEDLK